MLYIIVGLIIGVLVSVLPVPYVLWIIGIIAAVCLVLYGIYLIFPHGAEPRRGTRWR